MVVPDRRDRVEADGFSLDDKRAPVKENDIPDLLETWAARDPQRHSDRTKKHFFVPTEDIRTNKYDLSVNRYREVAFEEVEYDPPQTIVKRLEKLDAEIAADLRELKDMLAS